MTDVAAVVMLFGCDEKCAILNATGAVTLDLVHYWGFTQSNLLSLHHLPIDNHILLALP